jgi:RHS repeat-associated protein
VAGSTSSFTYDVTEPNANLYIYNPNVSSAVSPTGAETPAGTSIAVGALIAASGSTSPATTTDSTWDVVSGGSVPLNINDATTTSGVTTNTSYIYGDLLDGGTAPIEQIKTTSSGATEVYLVANQTGVQGVFSSAGGLDELALYTLYGRQTIVSGTDVTPFGFQGSYTDSTGLIYLINRYYDPTTDQFLSIDPDAATTDQPYVFTNDDPLNSTDPLGLSPHGDRNVEDTEFIGISTEQLQKEYDALKGNLTPEQKAYKQRLKTTLKGRGARPSSAQKFISVFQAPLTSTENFMSTINNEMQSPAMKVEETAAGGAIVVWLGYLALGALL